MTGFRDSALRFFHGPRKAAVAVQMGFRLGPAGRIEVASDDDAVRESILLLLATEPGERVMRPDYGCNLRVLNFSPNDLTTAGLAIHYVRRALERFEPRIDILHLDANPDPLDPTQLIIELEYAVRSTRVIQQVRHVVPLYGESM
ncbi:MAG: GPW/gp25 family protein [Planctomycetota bacterium]|jgi:phage baseplate assembly protein W